MPFLSSILLLPVLAGQQFATERYLGVDEEWTDPSSGLRLTIDRGHDPYNPAGMYIVSWRGRKWKIAAGDQITPGLQLVVIPRHRRIISLSWPAIACRDYTGRPFWAASLRSMSDPGDVVVEGDTVLYDIGVCGNPRQAGYGDEAGALRDGACTVVARNLLTGRQIWSARLVAVGLPVAPVRHRKYMAIYEQNPLRHVRDSDRRFSLAICATATHKVIRRFEIPRLVCRKMIDLYQFGISLVDLSVGRKYVRYRFRKDLYWDEHETILHLKLSNDLTRAEWRYGSRRWVVHAARPRLT